MAVSISRELTPGPATRESRPGVWLTDALLLLMALIWGINYSVVKFGTTVVAPLAYNGVRVTVAALALFVVAAIIRAPGASRRDIIALFALGVLGNGIYQWFFIEGVARTRAGDVALVLAAAPAFIALLGRLRGSERIDRRGMLGIALSIAGIGLVGYGGASGATRGSSFTGDALALAGCLCWSVYSVLVKPYTHRIDPVRLSAWTMAGGAVPLLVVAAPSIAATRWAHVPVLGWGALGYSAILALVVAYLFWYRGLRVLGPTKTAMYGNLQPLIALVFAWIALAEVPTLWQIVGTVAIMVGLLLTRAAPPAGEAV